LWKKPNFNKNHIQIYAGKNSLSSNFLSLPLSSHTCRERGHYMACYVAYYYSTTHEPYIGGEKEKEGRE
jgi:hypothetical protein